MEAHPGHPAEDSADERDERGADGGEDAGERGRLGCDGDARETVESRQDVHWLPAIAVMIATTTATTIAQIQTAMPCFAPLNRAIRPATDLPAK